MIYTVLIYTSDDGAVLELDGIGRTALMYAVHFNNLDALQILLEQGAEADAIAHGNVSSHLSLL